MLLSKVMNFKPNLFRKLLAGSFFFCLFLPLSKSICQAATTDIRVGSSFDDAEERASGSMYLDSSDLELVYDGSNQTVGMRFNGLNIPQGTTITNAYVQFQVDETNSEAASLTIQGENIDNALTFTSSGGNISSRARTTAGVSWSPVPWTTKGEAGPDQQTPNLASVIQEIVNRSDWLGGNSLVIIITGTGERVAEAYEGVPSAAPLLHIEYDTEPSPSPSPTPSLSPSPSPSPTPSPSPHVNTSFSFVSWADTKTHVEDLASLSNQIVNLGLEPVFTIYPGDLEDDGFTIEGMNLWKNALNGDPSGVTNNGMFEITLPVRGNHDDQQPDSALNWQNYYDLAATAQGVGATNYSSLSDDLSFSFDYGNSHFIGVDVPGGVSYITPEQIDWIDTDLGKAEARGLTHAFVYFHGPIYCVDGHCSCDQRVCEPTHYDIVDLVNVFNKHPIVTATFHGHEHLYTYTHIDNTRIPEVTHEF